MVRTQEGLPNKEEYTIKFIERLLTEHEELARKMEALTEFMDGDVYPTLSPTEQGLLMCQARVMRQYLDILEDRIDVMSPPREAVYSR